MRVLWRSGLYGWAADNARPNESDVLFMEPIVPVLANVEWGGFFPALLAAGGVVAGLFGLLIGAPVLRLTDDYLAIATLALPK